MNQHAAHEAIRGINGEILNRTVLPAGVLALLLGWLYAPVAPLLVWLLDQGHVINSIHFAVPNGPGVVLVVDNVALIEETRNAR